MLHLLYTYAVTPGQPEATTKAREGLRDALSCYNKALGDEKARCRMRDVDWLSWLPVCQHANQSPLTGCKPQIDVHTGRCALRRFTQFANLSISLILVLQSPEIQPAVCVFGISGNSC